jgi:hypothetical protein
MASVGYELLSPPSKVINLWADRNVWVSDRDRAHVWVMRLQHVIAVDRVIA